MIRNPKTKKLQGNFLKKLYVDSLEILAEEDFEKIRSEVKIREQIIISQERSEDCLSIFDLLKKNK